MKNLSEYMEEAQTALFKKYGVFFAFSSKQFMEQHTEGVTYVSMGAGMYAPKEHGDAVHKELGEIYKAGIKQDVEENGIHAITERELANHEVYWTGDITPAADALEDYPGIDHAYIYRVHNETYCKHVT